MPNSAAYRTYATKCDDVARHLSFIVGSVGKTVPTSAVSGGRLTSTVNRSLEASTSNVSSAVQGVLVMAQECRKRQIACEVYEAQLASYQRALANYHQRASAHHNAQAAYDAAVRNAKPGATISAAAPGAAPIAPTAPRPPSYWSA
jgi:hypothetical protein